MKVCAVIVTYGDRFHLLRQVMDACYNEGVNKIIVIDNASEENSKKQLKEYEEKESRLRVVYLNENTGSAGGYKRGLQEAYKCQECEFIWLLDDDNQPQKDSLKVLKDFWDKLEDENKEEKVALLSYRDNRLNTKPTPRKLGKTNSFFGFHISDLPKKVFNVFKRKLGFPDKKNEIKNTKFFLLNTAPYGGTFLNNKLLNIIGFPKEEYYLYGDDLEWSNRIISNNGKIYLVVDSYIRDIDISWATSESPTTYFYAFLNKGEDFRVYYSIRNGVNMFFNLKENNTIYYLNKFIYMLILRAFVNKNNINRYKLIKKAINDGENNKLGKTL